MIRILATVAVLLLPLPACEPPPLESAVPVPVAAADFRAIWAYAASLRAQVESYAPRRWGTFPEGLRRAVGRHRLEFFSTGAVAGAVADLQSYLYFEYRRRVSLDGGTEPGEPDAQTRRYIRGLLRAIRQGGRP